MVNGVNQNVDIFGRVFHVQTEVTTGAQPMVRSTVYLGGSVVGTRESRIDPRIASEEGIREQIDAQHALIIDNLVKREAELEAEKSSVDVSEPRPHTTQQPAPKAPEKTPLPLLESDPELAASVKVRQLIGPFSFAFRPSPYHDTEAVRARLESAADMIEEIMNAPAFPDIRLDEQVRFFDLKERLTSWHGSGRDPDVGAEILLDVVVFAGHLQRINDRRELAAFDHALITWALSAVGRTGASDEVFFPLRSLYGRDPDLDHLLDQPDDVETERLLEVLLGLLDRTLPGDF
jgi:hypothetical protein